MEKEHVEVLLEDISGKLQLLAEGHMVVLERFQGVDRRLDGIDCRLDGIDCRLDGIDRRLDGIDRRLDGIDGRFEERFDRLESYVGETLAEHDARLAKVEKRRR